MRILRNNREELLNKSHEEPILGLSSEEVTELTKQGLTNKVKKHVTKSYWEIITTNLLSYFNILLFIIAGFMLYYQLFSGMFFALILIGNIVIGLIQDIHARKKTDKLRLVTMPRATVVRDGQEKIIDTSEIVLGDVVIIRSGNQVCCDGIIIRNDITLNESLLTGESVDVDKKEGDQVYGGSYVTSGTCYIKVNKVGEDSYAETLRKKASKFKRPNSEILKSLKIIFNIICVLVTILGIGMILANVFQFIIPNTKTVKEIVEKVSGSMVSMIPSGMYLLTSLTLAAGVIRLAYNKMLVQELYCIETLARSSVVCFDKTGTITTGNMNVSEYFILDEKYSKEEVSESLKTIVDATNDSNATAKAIRNYVGDCVAYKTVSYEAFSSKTKQSKVRLLTGEELILGAIEFIDVDKKEDLLARANNYAQRGFRTLLLASKVKNKTNAIALIILSDEINAEAYATLKWFSENDVKIKIISGDNVETVRAIAREVGLVGYEKAASLAGLSEEEVKKAAIENNVFGRVTPEQKEIIVNSLKDNGEVVAMTGDGVNDILALKRADCSIAMSGGSDAVKDVAYMVALDSNFSSLPKVVEEGRRVINNLQRTCSLFLVKTFFAFVLTTFFLFVQLINPKYIYPFTTNNMYLWEILTIGVDAFVLALQPNKERIKGSFVSNIISKATPAAICQIAIVLILFFVSLISPSLISYEQAMSCAVIGFNIFSVVILLSVCLPFDKYRFILYMSTVVVTIGLYFVDFFLKSEEGISFLFKINYGILDWENIITLTILVVIMVPIYYLLYKLFSKILKKK